MTAKAARIERAGLHVKKAENRQRRSDSAQKGLILMREAPVGFQPPGTEATLGLWIALSDQRSGGFVDTLVCPSLVASRSPPERKLSCDEAGSVGNIRVQKVTSLA